MDFLTHHILRSAVCHTPEKEALICGDERLTYAQVASQIRGVADGLRAAGVKRGDRVGVQLHPSTALAVSLLGISQAGGVFVPIHHDLFPQQVAYIARDCDMKGLITDAGRFRKLMAEPQGLPSLEFASLTDSEETDTEEEVNADTIVTCCLTSWRKQATPEALCDVAIEKDLAAILYTSGSTGRPKGVMLSHANLLAGASIVSTYLDISASERILAVLPFSFDVGLNQMITAFQQGATCVILDFHLTGDIIRALRNEQITGLAGVPTLWSLLAQGSSLSRHTFPHLRYITNTGGAMPQHVLTLLRESLPTTRIFLMYGLTEAFRSTYLPPEELSRRPTSMGRAIPDTDILVVSETGELCGPGEVGELVHHGPTVALGYWGQPEKTAEVYRPHPFLPPGIREQMRVVYSGDLVRQDEEGFLHFVGRRDNLIKCSGFRVSPTEVEEGLCRSGKLHSVAVIGLPDSLLGNRIKAFVVPKHGVEVDVHELLASFLTHSPAYMAPKEIAIVDVLPKTPNGKIDYTGLKQSELEKRSVSQ